MSETDYGVGSQQLHRLALGSEAVAKASLEFELLLNSSKEVAEGPHVFVSGLARAGTTALLRALHDQNAFRSLTYRDMPFVLMPQTWRRLSKPFQAKSATRERAHGDGVQVSTDSPEALEEVFWRVHCGRDYITKESLKPHTIDGETRKLFRQYVTTIIGGDRDDYRYLSKNNNSILRLEVLRKAFPNAVIVAPFRDPRQHALSLLAQHKLFCERHKEDRFSLQYMTWLGHHEFGEGHKPFHFTESDQQRLARWDENDPNYWLTMWINTYRYLSEHAPERVMFISYNSLCENGEEILDRILSAASLPSSVASDPSTFRKAKTKDVDGFDEQLVKEATELDERLHILQSEYTAS